MDWDKLVDLHYQLSLMERNHTTIGRNFTAAIGRNFTKAVKRMELCIPKYV